MVDILRKKKVIAVSPVIGNEPVSGPAGKLMRSKGLPVSSAGVAAYYKEFLDIMVIDNRDTADESMFEEIGCKVVRADTLMKAREISMDLSRLVMEQFNA
jgi:LPPG:FO 2-phospho-L-lactate transferase